MGQINGANVYLKMVPSTDKLYMQISNVAGNTYVLKKERNGAWYVYYNIATGPALADIATVPQTAGAAIGTALLGVIDYDK